MIQELIQHIQIKMANSLHMKMEFRALHNHPIDLSAINTETDHTEDFTVFKRKCEETSLAFKY